MKKAIILMLGVVLSTAFINEANAQRRTSKVATTSKVVRVPRTKVTYKKPRAKVLAVRTIPNKRTIVSTRGEKYFFSNNRYYRYYNGRYIHVAPRVGLRIGILPPGFRTIVFAGRSYFYFDGVYYEPSGDEYEVVYPELGTVIYELPDNYEKVEYDGDLLYEANGVLYEKVQVDGTRAYEVVGIIED